MNQRSPDPFFYAGGDTGVLLIHGFTGTPSEMRPLGQYLKEKGYTVHAPLLKGHGTSPEEMMETCWQDWWESVQEAYQHLREQGVRRLFVVGLSMGGCFSLYLASQVPVDGVVSLCAPIWVKDPRIHFVDLVKGFKPFIPRAPNPNEELESHLVPYDRTPLKCVSELRRLIRVVKKNLFQVTAPTLVIQSRQDDTVLPRSAEYIYKNVMSLRKKLSWYEKSGHLIVIDKERKELFREIEEFIENTRSE